MNTTLILILGPSGSGKSTLARQLHRNIDNSNLVIPSTTRPARNAAEIMMEEYHFAERDYMPEQYICIGVYNDWIYWVSESEIRPDTINILIGCDAYINDLINYFGKENIICIYTNLPDRQRLINALTREDNPDCAEICRRYLAGDRLSVSENSYIINLKSLFENSFFEYNYINSSFAELMYELEIDN